MIIILKGLLDNPIIQQFLTGVVTAASTWLIALINKRKTVKKIVSAHESALIEKELTIESLKKQLNGKAWIIYQHTAKESQSTARQTPDLAPMLFTITAASNM